MKFEIKRKLVAKTEKIILVAFPAMSPSNTFSLLAGQILNKNVQIAMLEISFHTVYSQYFLYEQEKVNPSIIIHEFVAPPRSL